MRELHPHRVGRRRARPVRCVGDDGRCIALIAPPVDAVEPLCPRCAALQPAGAPDEADTAERPTAPTTTRVRGSAGLLYEQRSGGR
jgi:hypothetical protein